MARQFRPTHRDQPMLLPPDLRDWLPLGHLVYVVLDVVGRLDLRAVRQSSRLGGAGREAYDPAMLTALLLYAYCVGVRSSREIERRCETDVAFRVLTALQRPDHSTIARFRKSNSTALAGLFGQVLSVCSLAGMVKVGSIAIDGTKIAADASSLRNRTEQHLRKLAQEVLAEADGVDAREDAEHGAQRRGDELPQALRPGTDRAKNIQAALEELERQRQAAVAADAADATKARDRLKRSMVGEIDRQHRRRVGRPARANRRPLSERKQVKDYQGRIEHAEQDLVDARDGKGPAATALGDSNDGRGPKINLTDPDSRSMPNKSKGYVQGYNAQVVVSDDHLILATDVVTCTNDQGSFVPMMNLACDVVAEHLGPDKRVSTVLADAGYFAHAALTAPGPDRLIAAGRRPDQTTRNYPEARQMAARLADGTVDRAAYSRRGATVEPVIGHLKDRIGLRRFARRGLLAVREELAFAAIAHNILRLATI